MHVLFVLALRNLVQAPRRTLLLGTAVALVTAILVLLQAMSGGIRDNLIRCATTIAAGHVVVGGFYKVSPGSVAPVVSEAARIRRLVEEQTPGLDYVVDRSRGWAKIVSPTASIQSGLAGVTLANEPRLEDTLALAPERDYRKGGSDAIVGDLSRLAERDAVVLFASQARRLKVGVGDALTLQTEVAGGRTNTVDVTVVAVARDVGILSSFNVFVTQELVRELYQLDADTTGAIWVYLDDIAQSDAVMKHLRVVLAEQGYPLLEHEAAPFYFKFEGAAGEDWVGQRLDVTTWQDEVSFLSWVVTAFDGLTGFLVSVLSVIVAIGIMNATWNSVRARTQEIGTMRAVGMTRARVLTLFLTEAALLGLCAAGVGGLVGAGAALGIDAAEIPLPDKALETILLSDTLHFVVHPRALAGAVFALAGLTTLSALWPASQAARMRPIVALGHVE